jgi:hypothetical protein
MIDYMKDFAGDVWEAFKIVLVGLFMHWIALGLTVKLLWDWLRE